MDRLLLVRHAPTAATRRAAFSLDEPLDAAGVRDAQRLSGLFGQIDAAFSSPLLRARQTAEAAGVAAALDGDLAECDFGVWAGLSLEEVGESDPGGLRRWFSDFEAAPHGGESLAQLFKRAGAFLDRARVSSGTTIAVTHGGVIKAAVLSVLGAPPFSTWRIDVAPCSITELRRHDGRWTVTRTNWIPD